MLHLIICQPLFREIPQFQRLYLQYSYLTAQRLVRSESNIFQLYLSTFPLCLQCHRFRAGQCRNKVTDAVQMNLPALPQLASHKMRQSIEYRQYIRLGQRAVFLYMPAQFIGRCGAVQFNPGVQGQLFALLSLRVRVFLPIK